MAHQDLFEKHPVAFDHSRFRKILLKEVLQNLGLYDGSRGVVVPPVCPWWFLCNIKFYDLRGLNTCMLNI